MSKNQKNYDEIREKHLDTMIKLAFEYEDALEAHDNAEEVGSMPSIDAARKDAVWNKAVKEYSELKAEEKKRSRIAKFRRSIPRIIQVAACLVLVIGIATPFAIANVDAIRVKVMRLLIDIQADHTELRFVENENETFYVPAQWQGSYYPMYIPDGFILYDISMLANDATFMNENGDYIYYSECTEKDYVDINSENASLSYTKVNGYNALVVERERRIMLTWNTEDRYFVIIADATIDEVLDMARSVRRISSEK